MNYEKIYNQIIECAQNRKLEGYKEKHHIIPKCLGGLNEKENLVELTAKEHFLCHKLLCEIHPSNPKLMWALWLMAIGKQKSKVIEPYKVGSREYERLKMIFIKQSKLKKITDVHKKQVSKANSKSICQYDIQGNFIKKWDSAVDAEKFCSNKPNATWKKLSNNINDCCRKKQKTAYGYIWKYEEDILNLEEHKNALNKRNGEKRSI